MGLVFDLQWRSQYFFHEYPFMFTPGALWHFPGHPGLQGVYQYHILNLTCQTISNVRT